jgi:hypothetical protein
MEISPPPKDLNSLGLLHLKDKNKNKNPSKVRSMFALKAPVE